MTTLIDPWPGNKLIRYTPYDHSARFLGACPNASASRVANLEGGEQLHGKHVVGLDFVQRRRVRVVCDALHRLRRCQQPQLLPFACTHARGHAIPAASAINQLAPQLHPLQSGSKSGDARVDHQ